MAARVCSKYVNVYNITTPETTYLNYDLSRFTKQTSLDVYTHLLSIPSVLVVCHYSYSEVPQLTTSAGSLQDWPILSM